MRVKYPLSVLDCGLIEYREALRLQHELHEQRCRGEIPNTVLIAEHPCVITLGTYEDGNKLLASREQLQQKRIEVVRSRRGGGATAHNPGQLVFYPILNLKQLGLGVGEYIRELEGIGAELLKQLGLACQRRKGFPGLWIVGKKIACIGVRISKCVSYHGMAINIQNDLDIFDFILPCGLEGVEMTSVWRQSNRNYSMGQVKEKLSQLLIKHFSIPNESPATSHKPRRKLPSWLHRPLPVGGTYTRTENILSSLGIETICTSANCPNSGLCWDRGTATVMILGRVCTRNCRFCAVEKGRAKPPDPSEPERVAEMVKRMGIKFLVITSVDRDDLPDGGASYFRDCINQVRRCCPDVRFEILTPDFRGYQRQAVKTLKDALPFVFAHNIETVPSLYHVVRAGGDYQLSLNLLRLAKENYEKVQTKSSVMLGLGEADAEVEQVLRDLRDSGCDRITIGQYLKPSKKLLDVVEYIEPTKFEWWRQKAVQLGFSWVMSSPFARSSYLAEQENMS